MIHETELRIGNLVYICVNEKSHSGKSYPVNNKEIATVDSLAYDEIHISKQSGGYEYLNRDGVNPIPLTEEWLTKFGFIWYDNRGTSSSGMYNYHFSGHYFEFSENNVLKYEGYKSTPITTLHQLQNFIFALTGEELTIKI